MEQILLDAIEQAKRNLSQAAFDEDYSEAAVWQIKVEALEDVLAEAGINKQDNVVNLHG